jgi:hypothetical protein
MTEIRVGDKVRITESDGAAPPGTEVVVESVSDDGFLRYAWAEHGSRWASASGHWEVITENDPVSHPSHYTSGKIEVLDFIEDQKLGFHRGNAVKYIARAGKKDPDKVVEDIRKAIFYLERYIAKVVT